MALESYKMNSGCRGEKAHLKSRVPYAVPSKLLASNVKDGISRHADLGVMLLLLFGIKLLGAELHRKQNKQNRFP